MVVALTHDQFPALAFALPALLAAGLAGTGALSHRVAPELAFQAGRHRGRQRFSIAESPAGFTGPGAQQDLALP